MQQTTRNTIRKAAKALGYKIQFKTNSLNPAITSVGFFAPGAKESTVSANVFPAEFRQQHEAIFELLNSYKGFYLTDCEQKLV